MKRVFVSYSSHDRPAVASVVAQLTAAGFDVWFDQNVSGGQQWWDVILEQLRGCDVVAVMVTESSVSSAACRSELGYAEALGKTIVPVRLGEVDPAESPSDLQQRQWIDFREPTVEHTLALVKALNLASSSSLPDPLPTPPAVPLSYQTQVTDRIYSATPLTLDQQVGVVFGIRQLLADGSDPDHVVSLATQFRARDDLLAAVVPDADEVLARARTAAAGITRPIPTTLLPPPDPQPHQQAEGRPPRRNHRLIIGIGVAAIALITVIAVATSGGDKGDRGEAAADTTIAASDTTLTLEFTDTVSDTTVPGPFSTDVEVLGTESWTDTGIDVVAGDILTISADGEVVHNNDYGGSAGPDGDPDPNIQQFNVIAEASHAALIAELDGATPFFVGSSFEMTVETDGHLLLGPNDAGVDNNDGSFSVTITVTPAG